MTKVVKMPPPDKPGRPEFITFDTPHGLAMIFAEHITGIAAVADVDSAGEPVDYGLEFVFTMASNMAPVRKMGLSRQMATALLTVLITQCYMKGRTVRGKFIDLDSVMAQFRRPKGVERPEGQPAPDGSALVGPDGAPLARTAPRIVSLEEAAAEGA